MKLIKNMEAVFVVTLGLACSAAYVLDTVPAQAQAPIAAVSASAATPSDMAVVVVSAKRMTPAEKAASLEAERKLAGVGVANRSSI